LCFEQKAFTIEEKVLALQNLALDEEVAFLAKDFGSMLSFFGRIGTQKRYGATCQGYFRKDLAD
jgi:hypothetical protein